jgi:hypothetical protein
VIPRLVETAVAAGLKVERAQLLGDALFAATVHRALPSVDVRQHESGGSADRGDRLPRSADDGRGAAAAGAGDPKSALGASAASVVTLLVRQQLLATLAGLVGLAR